MASYGGRPFVRLGVEGLARGVVGVGAVLGVQAEAGAVGDVAAGVREGILVELH